MKSHFETSNVSVDAEEPLNYSQFEEDKGLWHRLKNNKKFLYGLAICLACFVIVLGVLIFPSNLQVTQTEAHPKAGEKIVTTNNLKREDYARITKETYDKYYSTIANMDLKDSDTVKRRLLQIHFPVGPMEFQRRNLMRILQIEPYKKKYDIDWKFIIGEPDPIYAKSIKAENDTHGDIIILPGYADSRQAGRTTKSPEYYQWLEQNTAAGKEFKYIGRIDSDCYVNFDKLFAEKFTPNVQNNDGFMIVTAWLDDLLHYTHRPNDWPQGSFYLFSWKMMLMYNKFYRAVPRELECDDQLIGRYVYDSKLNYSTVRLNSKEAYDIHYTWEWDTKYKIKDSIRIHELKSDKLYSTIGSDLATLAEHNMFDFNDQIQSVTKTSKIGDKR